MLSLYSLRCMNTDERREWEASGLVRVDSLRHGDTFEAMDGTEFTVVRQTSSGTILVVRSGHREPDWFVPTAMVRKVVWDGLQVVR